MTRVFRSLDGRMGLKIKTRAGAGEDPLAGAFRQARAKPRMKNASAPIDAKVRTWFHQTQSVR